ncbi:GNAT family N-acetyltransferase [Nonomuraea typhae]|uniref:GNAT family N-acetyltransferase n=1 Tax=Nonomuraea typhae TaxID=2603600 RepID=UPI0012FAA9FE|nr:GNAT family N-acetyltransferase [Nonomuraea typhae]
MKAGIRQPVTGWERIAPGDLPALKPAWNDLYDRCATATPFQSHAWITSWWQRYGGRNDLRVLVLRGDDRLLAALPLMRSHLWGCRVLRPLGTGLSDYTDMLVDDEHAGTLLPEATRALLRTPGWDVLDFPEVRPGAAVESLHRCWPDRRWLMTASDCLYMPAMPLEELIATMGARTAGKLRRTLRRSGSLDLRITTVHPEQVPAAIDDLLRLHAMQWSGRAINKEHLRPRFRRHLVQSATELIATGQAALTEFRVGDRLVASDFCLVGGDFTGGYLYGADPWLRTRVDTFAMVIQQSLRRAHERGLRTVSLLRGNEPHKAKWGATAVANQRVILGRTRRAAAYAAAVSARIRAARALKEHFPSVAGAPSRPEQ